ncbi:MAG: hypothetical protein FJ395_15000 [Verrucomicrobia bacterium]|nr:hypothetical protein [Verrucomicrobiota bacterium]
MKIDFDIKYSPKSFNEMCEVATRLGLDALVIRAPKGVVVPTSTHLKIFSGIETEWDAVYEIEALQDFLSGKDAGKTEKKTVHGKALSIFPTKVQFPENLPTSLFDLIETVSKMGGVIISMHDDNNATIPLLRDDSKQVYQFHASRIRPYKFRDVALMLPYVNLAVAGSGARNPLELRNGAYTYFSAEVTTNEGLIEAIRNKANTRLYVRKGGQDIRIEETVPRLTPSMR